MADFRLIETIRVSAAGEACLLDRHLDRLSHSARAFSFRCDPAAIREAIARVIPRGPVPARLRLTLAADGAVTVEMAPLPAGYVEQLRLSARRVDSTDVFLYHKTTNRSVYGERTDVILLNEREELTETPIMNIAVQRDGRWLTPPVSCGLLPGVMRAELLARGEIVEGAVRESDLLDGEVVRCFNALRGVCDVPLLLAKPS
jgi:branched-subunit amino acid aminotransferase/4-amino-4-deoxychorismate lyase